MKNRRIATFTLIIGLILIALCLGTLFKNPNVIWISLIPMGVVFISIICIISINRLLKQFSAINVKKIGEISISCPKIEFLTTPELTPSANRVRQKYYGIKIIDKQKFYYFFGECYEYTAEDLKKIHTKLHGKIYIQYYEGTTIIKTIQNDPHFLKIKVGSF